MPKIPTLAIALACFAAPAFAGQNTCGERETIVDHLSAKYKESHQATGMQSATKLLELWISQDTGSWTILITDASGKSCIAAAGQSWLELEQEKITLGKAS